MFYRQVLFACALAAFCGSATAASIDVRVDVSRVVLDDFVAEAAWTPDGNGALIDPGQETVYAQVDFFVEIHDLAGPPDEVGLGIVNFDALIAGDASDTFGWIADMSIVDHDGDPMTPPFPKWAEPCSLCVPSLIDIVVGVAPQSFGPEGIDPRRTLGQHGPEFMGSVFANIDSNQPGASGTVAAVMRAFSTYDAELLWSRNFGPMRGDSLVIRVIPEPAALALLGLGLAILALRRSSRN